MNNFSKFFVFFFLLSLTASDRRLQHLNRIPTPHQIITCALIMRSISFFDAQLHDQYFSDIKKNVEACDLNTNNKWGQLPLNTAVSYADIPATELFLQHGAHVNARDEATGATALMSCVYTLLNHQDKPIARSTSISDFEGRLYTIVDKLLFAGADINISNNFGSTPFSIAQKTKLHTLLNIFEQNILPECSICLDKTSRKRKMLECDHNFHPECINQWLEENKSCPMCREIVE